MVTLITGYRCSGSNNKSANDSYLSHLGPNIPSYVRSLYSVEQSHISVPVVEVGDELVNRRFIKQFRKLTGVDVIVVIDHHVINGVFAVVIVFFFHNIS